MRHTLVLLLVSASLSCSDASPVAMSPSVSPAPPVSPASCGHGPFEPGRTAGACPQGACPIAPPPGTESRFGIRTCSFTDGAPGCQPLPGPACGRGGLGFQALLVKPGTTPPSLCGGEFIGLIGESTGGALEWQAFDLAPAPGGGCAPAGPMRFGKSQPIGPCCEEVIDVPIPSGGFTFRIAIQRDWEQ